MYCNLIWYVWKENK